MKSVLVVDDTKNIRLLLTKCLELEGYRVKTANDGQEALTLFKSDKFDLAFLDIKMPQLSGTEVLKRVREMGINTPVIIITAYATVKNAVDCTQMGAVAYLQKPFTADKVRSVLSDIFSTQCMETANCDPGRKTAEIEDAISRGSFSEALDMLKKVISAEPANPDVYLLFSRAYQGIGDIEHARKFYNMHEVLNTR